MPSLPIPLGLTQDSGVEEFGGAAPLSANVVADAGKSVRRRPAMVAWGDFPTPAVASDVIGMAVFGDYLIYVTADRKIHAWEAPGLVVELSDATAATQLDGSARPTFAVTSERITIAGGGALQTWTGAGLSSRLAGSPPNATHVIAINTRLVANVRGNTGQFQWSDPGVGGHVSWPALNFTEAESRADPLTSLYENTSEILAIGTTTTQFFVADPTTGFATVRTVNTGSRAPYAFCADVEVVRWLDNRKVIVESDGRSVLPISSPSITSTLRDLVTTVDTWAFHADIGTYRLSVFVMPTEQRAFVYSADGKSWSEWRGRSATDWTGVPFSSYCYFPAHELHLVGTSTGHIRQLSMNAYADLDGVLLGEMVSGFLDRGSQRGKMCEAVKLTFRHTAGTSPRASLSWRDDTGDFGNPIHFDIERSGTVEIRSLGTYRQREWKLTMSDDAPLTLVSATEDYQMLEI